MEEYDIYKDIRERTNGDIYIGVVGPVRAGKSTFITNFMQKLVMPRIVDRGELERMRDELPQSASGKAIMTTQPKFVPNDAVELVMGDNLKVNVRLVDCVGYFIDGAIGNLDEEGKPRMVKTPWSDKSITFEDAAEIGTRKVIEEHSTIGIVMTSDGSIDTDIARVNYVQAEERVVKELTGLGKPFVVVLNSKVPTSAETVKLATGLSEKYGTAVIPMDVLNVTEDDILALFEKMLMEFPLKNIDVDANKWLQALPASDDIISELCSVIYEKSKEMSKMSDYVKMLNGFEKSTNFSGIEVASIDFGVGKISYSVKPKEGLFYEALSSECGSQIPDDFALISYIKELVHAKKEYDKISDALDSVKETGYGVVRPSLEEMRLEDPEIVKQGSRFGVKLRASAPSLHIMQVDINAEVSPIMGTEQQSEEMAKKMLGDFESNPKGIWQTDMFGKSMHMLVNEGLNNKLQSMPEEAQKKMRKTLTKIVNEGKGGVICILL